MSRSRGTSTAFLFGRRAKEATTRAVKIAAGISTNV